MSCVWSLTFQRLVDVVVQIVDPQAVIEVGRVLLRPVSHHIDGHIAVVLPHLTPRESNGSMYFYIYISKYITSTNNSPLFIDWV